MWEWAPTMVRGKAFVVHNICKVLIVERIGSWQGFGLSGRTVHCNGRGQGLNSRCSIRILVAVPWCSSGRFCTIAREVETSVGRMLVASCWLHIGCTLAAKKLPAPPYRPTSGTIFIFPACNEELYDGIAYRSDQICNTKRCFHICIKTLLMTGKSKNIGGLLLPSSTAP